MNLVTAIKTVLLLLMLPTITWAEGEGAISLSLARQKLYQGESTTAHVTFMSPGNSIKNLQLPQFGNSGGFSTSGFSLADQQEMGNGTIYRFSATITAKNPGDFAVGPVSMSGEYLSQADGVGGFFGETGSRGVTLLSEPLSLHVAKLPEKGRPARFDGAVGGFSLRVSASPAKLSTGEPVMVTTIISGHGNFSQFGCPPLPTSGFMGYTPVVRKSGSSLTCQQLLIPDSAGQRNISPVKFSFFNTSTASYQTLQSSPIPVTVTEVVGGAPLERSPNLPAPVVIPVTANRLMMGVWWWGAAIAAVVALLYSFFRLAPVKSHEDSKDSKSSVMATEDQGDGESGSAALLAFIATAENAAVTGDNDLFYLSIRRGAMILQGSNTESSILTEMIDRCDAVRYGLQPADSDALQETLQIIKKLACSA